MDFIEYVNGHREDIRSTIMKYIPLKDPIDHYKIVREYSERGGNYRRPGLLMVTGETFGASYEKLVLPAAAMQLSEDWILMHDDMEDDSELRRGRPALHRLYGKEIAVNAGDAAHIAMWRMLKDYMLSAGPELGNRVFEKFYNMLEYTVEGQYLETNFMFNTKVLNNVGEDFYYRIVSSKTCYYSVYGPMQIGAIIAGAENESINALKVIGEPAGIAFQIVDDILDMTADEKKFGKKLYGDLYEGKLTLIILYTYMNASSSERNEIDAIYSKPRSQKTSEEIMMLVDTIKKYDGIGYAKEVAEKYANKAREALEKHRSLMPENSFSQIFLSAIDGLYARDR